MKEFRFRMIATVAGEVGGRRFASGDLLTVRPIEAAMLSYRKLAKHATLNDEIDHAAASAPAVEPPPVEPPAPDPPAVTRRKRTYRRKDLVAEA